MGKTLLIALALGLGAYIPFVFGQWLPFWLNILLFAGFFLAAMVVTFKRTFKKPTQRMKLVRVLQVVGSVAYIVVVIGLIDVSTLAFTGTPVILVGGEGWADLIAFLSWALFIIPLHYILGTALLVVSQRAGSVAKKSK
jgi:hypothetical protein